MFYYMWNIYSSANPFYIKYINTQINKYPHIINIIVLYRTHYNTSLNYIIVPRGPGPSVTVAPTTSSCESRGGNGQSLRKPGEKSAAAVKRLLSSDVPFGITNIIILLAHLLEEIRAYKA